MSHQLEELEARLKNNLPRERREGLEQAQQLLQQGHYHAELMPLIHQMALDDPAKDIQQMAREILDTISFKTVTQPTSPLDLLVVVCENCGQESYFDRRLLCDQNEPVGQFEQDGRIVNRFMMACPKCKAEIEVISEC